MPPLCDAVGLVHHEEPGPNALGAELLAQPLETLGRDVQESKGTVGDCPPNRLLFGRSKTAVEASGG
jgi:hypothetical protein